MCSCYHEANRLKSCKINSVWEEEEAWIEYSIIKGFSCCQIHF